MCTVNWKREKGRRVKLQVRERAGHSSPLRGKELQRSPCAIDKWMCAWERVSLCFLFSSLTSSHRNTLFTLTAWTSLFLFSLPLSLSLRLQVTLCCVSIRHFVYFLGLCDSHQCNDEAFACSCSCLFHQQVSYGMYLVSLIFPRVLCQL